MKLFFTQPLYAPLLFPNESSDARDHAANERTYLSFLRLAVYLAVVSVAIFINFHLKHEPTPLEMRLSHPLGFIFWALALACLAAGFANYIKTVAKYARKAAIVQSGLKTQLVFGVVSCAIIAACGVFLAAEAQRSSLPNVSNSTDPKSSLRVRMGTTIHAGSIRPIVDAPADLLQLLAETAGQGLFGNT